ncbi:hypothetical protein [Streptomyces panaciradicis]|uniref:hypothetical protein n=1 Tax=Streptomyces panaciradicis TaxID=1470261 RepID=UPI00201D24CB|nr:hypothetical protein [Streptomyces panaciradicis]MCL6669329.1 hypothetical protein [Streptomyces panaciradicis]
MVLRGTSTANRWWNSLGSTITNPALTDDASEPGCKNIPSWAVVAIQDHNIPVQVQIAARTMR